MAYRVVIDTPEGTSYLPDTYPTNELALAAGEAWANALPVDDETYHASYGYDVEETPDWEALKAQVVPWDLFDYNSGDLNASDVARGINEGFDNLVESNVDYVSEQGYAGAKQILQDNGFDPTEWEDDPEFEELRYAVEGAMKFNVSALAPSALFIRMDNEIEMPDFTDAEETEAAKAELLAIAEAHGFTAADVDEVVRNATYGGSGGVGVIASGSDVIQAGLNHQGEGVPTDISGTAILYITDNMNGSGHYVTGGSTEIQVADLAEAIDYGRYSLGAIFGTSEWDYR